SYVFFFFFSSRRRHTRSKRDWSSDVCSSDLKEKIDFPVLLDNVEYSKRKVKLLKAKEGYTVFKRMLTYYIATVILNFLDTHSYHELQKKIHLTKGEKRDTFMNIGGQLIPKTEYGKLLTDIKIGRASCR